MSSMPTPVDTARRVSSAQPDTAWQSIIATQCSGRFAACQPPRGDAARKETGGGTRATRDAQRARGRTPRVRRMPSLPARRRHTRVTKSSIACHQGTWGAPGGSYSAGERRRERGTRGIDPVYLLAATTGAVYDRVSIIGAANVKSSPPALIPAYAIIAPSAR